jgi:hypothetical protein
MSSSSALRYLELTDRLKCQGTAAVYGVLRFDSLLSCKDVFAVDDVESLSFSFSKLDETGSVRDFATLLRAGRVVTAVYEDDSFDEWRVGPVERGRGKNGVIDAQCVSLWLDTVERADAAGKGWVSEVSAGKRIFDYSLAERTPSSILSTYVIPNLPSWITLGTVDPTFTIPVLDVTHMTPGACGARRA